MILTFIIIKPDAIERGLVGRIMARFEDMGLHILRIEKRAKNEMWCSYHYGNVRAACSVGALDKSIYAKLTNFMVNSPLIGIVLQGENVISRVRIAIGVTNPLEASPGTIRGDLGKYPGPYNLIHASDSLETVDREIKLFFNKETDA